MTDPVITSATTDDDLIDRIMVSYDADGDGITDEVVIDIPADGGEHMITRSAGTVPVPVVEVMSTDTDSNGLVDERQLDTTGDGVVDRIAVHEHADHGDGARTETVTYYAAVDDNGSFVITGAALRTETRTHTEGVNGIGERTETVRYFDGSDATGTPARTEVHTYDDQGRITKTEFDDDPAGSEGVDRAVTREYDEDEIGNNTETVRYFENGKLTQTTVHTYAGEDETIITKTAIYTYDASGDITQTVTHTYDAQGGGLTKTELSGAGSDPTTVELRYRDTNDDGSPDLQIKVKDNDVLQSDVRLQDIGTSDGTTDEEGFDGELDDVLVTRFYHADGETEKKRVSFTENDGDGLVDRIVTRTFDEAGSPETVETVEIERAFDQVNDDGDLFDRVVAQTFDDAGSDRTLTQRVIEDRFYAKAGDDTPRKTETSYL